MIRYPSLTDLRSRPMTRGMGQAYDDAMKYRRRPVVEPEQTPPVVPAGPRLTDLQGRIIAYLTEREQTVTRDIERHVTGRAAVIREALADLREMGLVGVTTDIRNNARLWTLLQPTPDPKKP